jgi:predicted acetyltransferase
VRAQLLERGRPDARYLEESVDRAERSVLLPVSNDGGGFYGPDPGDHLQRGGVGGVDIHRRGRCGGVAGDRLRRLPIAPRHLHTCAVDHGRREVQRVKVRRTAGAARGVDRIGDAASLGEPVETRPSDRACDVDEQVHRSRLRADRRGDAGGSGTRDDRSDDDGRNRGPGEHERRGAPGPPEKLGAFGPRTADRYLAHDQDDTASVAKATVRGVTEAQNGGMATETRPVRPDEIGAFLSACEAAFGDGAEEAFIERFRRLHPADRTLAVFDGEEIVGTAGSYPFTVSVPGGEVAAAGVTVVGVKPTHRRRGLLRAMMTKQLADVRDRNEPIAVLWASEGSIYQRFGYGPGSTILAASIERARTRLLGRSDRSGTARLIDEDEAVKILPAVYERARAQIPGLFTRSEDWWRLHTMADDRASRRGAGPLFRMVWEDAKGPQAYALYRVKSEWDVTSKAVLRVREAMAVTRAAEEQLWRFLLGMDLVETIEVWLPQDTPLPLMVEEPNRLNLRVADGLWTRVVDLPEALQARSFAADGAVTMAVRDELCPWNDGTWRIQVRDGRADVARASDDPDLALSAREIGALYLGGTRATQLLRAGSIHECTRGAAAVADAIFASPRPPYCSEIF